MTATKMQEKMFYRLSELKPLIGVSGSTIWLWIKQGQFPKPVKLSQNTTAWHSDDIKRWTAERIAASRAGK